MSGGVTIKGHYYAVVVERKPRVAWLATEDGVLAIIYEGATTPWSWASLPGVARAGYEWTRHGEAVRLIHGYDYWLTSETRPEGRRL